MNINYPHTSESYDPLQRFQIGSRCLLLYRHTGRPPSTPYTMFWQDSTTPYQHAMSVNEVLNAISYELERVKAQETEAK